MLLTLVEEPALPANAWGVLGMLVVVVGGQATAWLASKRQTREQTDTLVDTLDERVDEIAQQVGIVAYRLDAHITLSGQQLPQPEMAVPREPTPRTRRKGTR